MKYTPQLIQKAKSSRCRICYEYISESEADRQEFHVIRTSRGGYCFIHKKCLDNEKSGTK